MYFKQFYLGCLAQGSYLLGSNGEAAVIDPQRDVDQYVKVAEENGLKIKYVIETHLHADFVSGHRELAERTGADILIGAGAGATFVHVPANDGDVFKVGAVELRILSTPGHTPESICVLARDTAEKDALEKLFTGDTLFIGDVGRPDLVAAKGYTATEMATLLFDSVHGKLSKLSNSTEIYPAHGAGSLCGKHLSVERSSTIGQQKLFNYAFKPGMTKDEFVSLVTTELPEVPAYFPKDVELNRQGAGGLHEMPRPKPMAAHEVFGELERGAVLLDVRSAQEFMAGHVIGSLNIGLTGQFAPWAGSLIPFGSRIVLHAADLDAIDEAVMRLARIGVESVVGYLTDGLSGWNNAGFEITETPAITVDELHDELRGKNPLYVVDVRRKNEFEEGHVPRATNIPLAELPNRIAELPFDKEVAVICASGYRSTVASSLLEKAGITSLVNVLGGMKAWNSSGY